MSSVLLLNASYEPLRIISTRRAVCLVLAEKAEVIEEKSGRLRSATASVAIPAVIRLRHFVQIPFKATYPLNRRSLVVRDNHECQVSGCERIGSTIDHVVPRSRGGRHEWANVALMCPKHNFAKADKSLEQMGWTLKREPRQPTGVMWLLIGTGVEHDPQWSTYLPAELAVA